MNWYEELFVKNDIRLPENHIETVKHLCDGNDVMTYGNGFFETDDYADLEVGQITWIKVSQSQTYAHGKINKISDCFVSYERVVDELPNHIMVKTKFAKFCFSKQRIGPAIVNVHDDGLISCQFRITAKSGYDNALDYSYSPKYITIGVEENDVVNPLGTEFFKDPILKMEYVNIVSAINDLTPAYAISKMKRLLDQI